MALTVSPGALQAIFAARCYECKRLAALESCVTRHGARNALEAQGWADHPQRGWWCPDCRTISKR